MSFSPAKQTHLVYFWCLYLYWCPFGSLRRPYECFYSALSIRTTRQMLQSLTHTPQTHTHTPQKHTRTSSHKSTYPPLSSTITNSLCHVCFAAGPLKPMMSICTSGILPSLVPALNTISAPFNY